jgi:hypothetical protein
MNSDGYVCPGAWRPKPLQWIDFTRAGAKHRYSQHEKYATPGLGDLITKATSAMGIQACQSCHARAQPLNRMAAFGGRR